jgi:hypothetical protein
MTYDLRETPPDPAQFVALREAAGMTARSLDSVRDVLPNTL